MEAAVSCEDAAAQVVQQQVDAAPSVHAHAWKRLLRCLKFLAHALCVLGSNVYENLAYATK